MRGFYRVSRSRLAVPMGNSLCSMVRLKSRNLSPRHHTLLGNFNPRAAFWRRTRWDCRNVWLIGIRIVRLREQEEEDDTVACPGRGHIAQVNVGALCDLSYLLAGVLIGASTKFS